MRSNKDDWRCARASLDYLRVSNCSWRCLVGCQVSVGVRTNSVTEFSLFLSKSTPKPLHLTYRGTCVGSFCSDGMVTAEQEAVTPSDPF